MTIALDKNVRINSDITAQEVRLVGIKAEPLGIVSLKQAFEIAEEQDTDLVEIAPKAVPPVCRLMDFGKFKYAQSKQMHAARLKQKNVQVKEVKFRPGTDDGDYQIKLRNLIRFLSVGDKAKPSCWCAISLPLNLNVTLAISPTVKNRIKFLNLIWQSPSSVPGLNFTSLT